MTLEELRPFYAEFLKRSGAHRPATLAPCHKCGKMLSARERRAACPNCGASNRKSALVAAMRDPAEEQRHRDELAVFAAKCEQREVNALRRKQQRRTHENPRRAAQTVKSVKSWGELAELLKSRGIYYHVERFNMSNAGALVNTTTADAVAYKLRDAIAFLSKEGVR
jgi:hypothetical protein